MSTKTSNLGLTKPALSDAADITAYNSNWDILDTQVSNIKNKVDNLSTDVEDLNGTLPISKGGTGATTASQARANLGAAPSNHTHNYAGSSTVGGSATSAEKLATSRNIRTDLSKTSTVKFDGTEDVTPGVTGTLPIGNGGTGATDADTARENLGAAASSHNHSASEITSGTFVSDRLPTVPINKGGTGATTAANARSNLGVPSSTDFTTLSNNCSTHFNNKSNPHDVTPEQIGLVPLEELPNLNVWMKCSGNPALVETEVKDAILSYYSPSGVDAWDNVSYADSIEVKHGLINLVNPTTFQMTNSTNNDVILGKYIYSTHRKKFSFVPEDATITNTLISTNNRMVVSKIVDFTTNGEKICYVASNTNDTYPENGKHTDGYWYIFCGQLGETHSQYSYGVADLTPGESTLETGKLYFVYE